MAVIRSFHDLSPQTQEEARAVLATLEEWQHSPARDRAYGFLFRRRGPTLVRGGPKSLPPGLTEKQLHHIWPFVCLLVREEQRSRSRIP